MTDGPFQQLAELIRSVLRMKSDYTSHTPEFQPKNGWLSLTLKTFSKFGIFVSGRNLRAAQSGFASGSLRKLKKH